MNEYYIYYDFVQGVYVVKRTAECLGEVVMILEYPSQRAPANKDVVREIIPYDEGTVRHLNFRHEVPYAGNIVDYETSRMLAIAAYVSKAKCDAPVMEILRRHFANKPKYRTATEAKKRHRKAQRREKEVKSDTVELDERQTLLGEGII